MTPSLPLLPLSDKARGKQRALSSSSDDAELSRNNPPDVSTSTQPEPQRSFVVRFSDGVPDLEMSVGSRDTVRVVQARIREARPSLSHRRLRLIHAGRLLTPGTLLSNWLSSLEEHQSQSTKKLILGGSLDLVGDVFSSNDAHAVKRAKDGEGRGEEVRKEVFVHCSIGPEISEEEARGEDERVQTAQITPLRGFDRLTSAGFTPDDIENVRRQFHSSRPDGAAGEEDGALQRSGEGEDDETARALEEQWIDDLTGTGTGNGAGDGSLSSPSPSQSEYTTLLQGLILGFFFPLIPFFFVRTRRADAFFSDEFAAVGGGGGGGGSAQGQEGGVYSRRMLMAVCFGFFSNIAYGSIRWFSI